MSAQILTVVGVALLGVLCDVILPDGTTKKYIRTVMGVVVTFVVASCVANLVDNVFAATRSTAVEPQQAYIAQVDQRRADVLARSLSDTPAFAGSPVKLSVDPSQSTVTVRCAHIDEPDRQAVAAAVENTFGNRYSVVFCYTESSNP